MKGHTYGTEYQVSDLVGGGGGGGSCQEIPGVSCVGVGTGVEVDERGLPACDFFRADFNGLA